MTERRSRPWHLYVFAVAAVLVAVLAVAEIGPPVSSARTSTQLVTAQKGIVQSTVSGTGNVEAGSDVNVNFQTSGTLSHVDVKTGQHVKKGQLLATLNSTSAQLSLDQAQQSLASAQEQLTAAQASSSSSTASLNTSASSGTTEFVSSVTTTPTDLLSPAHHHVNDDRPGHRFLGSKRRLRQQRRWRGIRDRDRVRRVRYQRLERHVVRG
jgi:multidrug efflux pump subunit AcrA (membrane-fusion protein)